MTFKRKKYLVIKKAITTEMANFIYGYFMMKRRVAKKFLNDRYISPFETGWGSRGQINKFPIPILIMRIW